MPNPPPWRGPPGWPTQADAADPQYARGERNGLVAGRIEATIVILAVEALLVLAFLLGRWLG